MDKHMFNVALPDKIVAVTTRNMDNPSIEDVEAVAVIEGGIECAYYPPQYALSESEWTSVFAKARAEWTAFCQG